MPRHDPTPRPPSEPLSERASLWLRYKKLMRWMVVAAIVSILLALIYLKSFGEEVGLHMQIATALGVGLTVIVGTGLMGLVFLSSRSGHDDNVTYRTQDDERD